MKDFRALLQAWRDWRFGAGPQTPEIERIEAVYASGLLAPTLQEAIRIEYLTPGVAKRKYGASHTAYYVRLRLAQESVQHLMQKLESAPVPVQQETALQ